MPGFSRKVKAGLARARLTVPRRRLIPRRRWVAEPRLLGFCPHPPQGIRAVSPPPRPVPTLALQRRRGAAVRAAIPCPRGDARLPGPYRASLDGRSAVLKPHLLLP